MSWWSGRVPNVWIFLRRMRILTHASEFLLMSHILELILHLFWHIVMLERLKSTKSFYSWRVLLTICTALPLFRYLLYDVIFWRTFQAIDASIMAKWIILTALCGLCSGLRRYHEVLVHFITTWYRFIHRWLLLHLSVNVRTLRLFLQTWKWSFICSLSCWVCSSDLRNSINIFIDHVLRVLPIKLIVRTFKSFSYLEEKKLLVMSADDVVLCHQTLSLLFPTFSKILIHIV